MMPLEKEIEKNLPKIEKFFTEPTRLKFSKTPAGHLEHYNFGLGTIIRLKLLRPKSALTEKFIQNGFTDKNKMTMELIREYYRYLHRNT